VPVDVAGARMRFQAIDDPLFHAEAAARGFGNDLQTARHGIDRAQVVTKPCSVETRRESLGKVDVVENVAKRRAGGLEA